jgi:hypothetical protein
MISLARVRALVSVVALTGGALSFAACGGSGGGGAQPQVGGQSKLLQKTFAGQNKCDPANHNRPFIIEWDATDMSSFQAFTADDVVLLKYEGCTLQVLEGCRNDSVRGSFGSYKPVTWTSGSVESVDVADEAELYAKLPLGAAELAPRVQSGEKFHMEYYVSGTRTATRDKIYKGDLAKNPACGSATHFVYGYNLGAFALASRSKLTAEVGGSYFGFGAGAKKGRVSSAEKKGGDLSACAGDTAKEVDACKVPIRLTLRPVSEGNSPDAAAAGAADTTASTNLASKVQADTDKQKQADEHYQAAIVKMNSKDGQGCVAELDQHDKLDPRPASLSTNPESGYQVMVRAQCLMAAGQCAEGRALFRRQAQVTMGRMRAAAVEPATDQAVGAWCQGSALTPRDEYLVARNTLTTGANFSPKEASVCRQGFDTIVRLMRTVKPKDADDFMVADPENLLWGSAPGCFAKSGDCASAWDAYKKGMALSRTAKGDSRAPDEQGMRRQFEGLVPACKSK